MQSERRHNIDVNHWFCVSMLRIHSMRNCNQAITTNDIVYFSITDFYPGLNSYICVATPSENVFTPSGAVQSWR
jgi:hypothetical protein